jgi:hypothetical protein
VVRAPLFAVVALLATILLPSAGAVTQGEKRVLVVLATAGPKPYSVAEVEQAVKETDTFLRASSFGDMSVRVDVTPWLSAFSANPGCGGLTNESFEAVVGPARVAATRAGYQVSHYDDAMYAIADSRCAFHGETWGHEVMLTRQPTAQLILHELGHTFGLGHAQATSCRISPVRCSVDGTGDTLSPMGRGTLDFSAYEKVTLGWIPPQPHVTAAGRYVISAATSKTTRPQALVLETEDGAWWLEYRSRPFRGIVVRFVPQRAGSSPFALPAVLLLRPTKADRPWIARGESFRLPGSFRLTLLRAGPTQAEVRFR